MSESRPQSRLRVVLDSNQFISGLIRPDGAPGRAVQSWRRGTYRLVTAPDLTDEFERIVARPSFSQRYNPDPAEIAAIRDELVRAEQVTPLAELPIHCRDPKDDMLLACALGGDADVLVTGDRDLLVLDGEPALGKLRVLSPQDFLAMLAARTA